MFSNSITKKQHFSSGTCRKFFNWKGGIHPVVFSIRTVCYTTAQDNYKIKKELKRYVILDQNISHAAANSLYRILWRCLKKKGYSSFFYHNTSLLFGSLVWKMCISLSLSMGVSFSFPVSSKLENCL